MATIEQLDQVRLNIDDKNDEDFTQDEKESYIDEKDSVNWASWQLIDILIVRLRKDTIKEDRPGSEATEFYDLDKRLELLQTISKKYKDAYESETGNATGKYFQAEPPIVAGGMI